MSMKSPGGNGDNMNKAALALTLGLNAAAMAGGIDHADHRHHAPQTESAHVMRYTPEVEEPRKDALFQIKSVESEAPNPDKKMSEYAAFKKGPKALSEAIFSDFPDPIGMAEAKVPGLSEYLKEEMPELNNHVLKAGIGREFFELLWKGGTGLLGTMDFTTVLAIMLVVAIVGKFGGADALKWPFKKIKQGAWDWPVDKMSGAGMTPKTSKMIAALVLAAGAAGTLYVGEYLGDERAKVAEAKADSDRAAKAKKYEKGPGRFEKRRQEEAEERTKDANRESDRALEQARKRRLSKEQ